MFSSDLLISFAIMSLIFLRQISIVKDTNKISYAPMILGAGAIGSSIHVALNIETKPILLITQESLIFLSISTFFYLIVNILIQNQQSQKNKNELQITQNLIEQMEQLKELNIELEKKMILSKNDEILIQEEMRDRFRQDLKSLEQIQQNQQKFLEKFNEANNWHNEVMGAFQDFTQNQLPSLDTVVHNHIDILRVAEQDHFNKVKATLAKALESRVELQNELGSIHQALQGISQNSKLISDEIVKRSTKEISEAIGSFEKQILFVKSHADDINTSLYEDENRLKNIKEHSEIIMRQMVLSSNKMGELEDKTTKLNNIYLGMKSLLEDIEVLKSEYVKAQSQLTAIIKEFKASKDDDIDNIKDQMESLIVILTTKIDKSLEKLHEHYNIANEDISQSVKILAKKSQLKHSYQDIE